MMMIKNIPETRHLREGNLRYSEDIYLRWCTSYWIILALRRIIPAICGSIRFVWKVFTSMPITWRHFAYDSIFHSNHREQKKSHRTSLWNQNNNKTKTCSYCPPCDMTILYWPGFERNTAVSNSVLPGVRAPLTVLGFDLRAPSLNCVTVSRGKELPPRT